MKDPIKVEAGRCLAAISHRKREELKAQKQRTGFANEVSQYYGAGAVLAVGVIGGLGYYIYRTKKGGLQSLGTHSTSREVRPQQPSHLQ